MLFLLCVASMSFSTGNGGYSSTTALNTGGVYLIDWNPHEKLGEMARAKGIHDSVCHISLLNVAAAETSPVGDYDVSKLMRIINVVQDVKRQRVFVYDYNPGTLENRWWVLDLRERTLRQLTNVPGKVRENLYVSPDGKFLALEYVDAKDAPDIEKNIRTAILDGVTFKVLNSNGDYNLGGVSVERPYFSEDSKFLYAYGGFDNFVTIDLSSFAIVHSLSLKKFDGNHGRVGVSDFKGSRLLLMQCRREQSTHECSFFIYDTYSGEISKRTSTPPDADLRLTPDGAFVVFHPASSVEGTSELEATKRLNYLRFFVFDVKGTGPARTVEVPRTTLSSKSSRKHFHQAYIPSILEITENDIIFSSGAEIYTYNFISKSIIGKKTIR